MKDLAKSDNHLPVCLCDHVTIFHPNYPLSNKGHCFPSCFPRSYDSHQKNVIAVSCAIGGGCLLVYWLLSRRRMKTLEMGDGWWGPGKKPLNEKEDEGIRPFQVKTSEKEIQVPRLLVPLFLSLFFYTFYLQLISLTWQVQMVY